MGERKISFLKDHEFQKIGSFVEKEFGISMPLMKKALIQGRLHKRLVALNSPSYGDYFDFILHDPAGKDEYIHFVDLISTHETSFFREKDHFEHLGRILGCLIQDSGKRSLNILSVACSTGEEAYSLAITVKEALISLGLDALPFRVEGFDLSWHAVDIATRAVYEKYRIEKVTVDLISRYFMRSRKDPTLYRVVPELRSHTVFHPGNLLDDMNLYEREYDIIFCRNVLIYFNRERQEQTMGQIIKYLRPKGYLYLGHSETFCSQSLPLHGVGRAVYRLS